MAVPIVHLIEDYEIVNNFGYFILDNASSNDACMKAILKNLHSDLDSNHCRLHNLNHVLNLAAKVFLLDKDFTTFDIEIEINRLQNDSIRELQTWLKSFTIYCFYSTNFKEKR